MLESAASGRDIKTSHPSRPVLARLARLAAWAGILAIAVLSLVPGQERPHTGLSGETEHFLAYACTGLVSSFAYLRSRERVLIWAGLAGASIAFEVLQNWIPGRIADVPDAIASTLGVTAGLLAGARLAAVILKQSRPLKRKAPPGAG